MFDDPVSQSYGGYTINRISGTFAHVDSWPEFLEVSETESPFDEANYFAFTLVSRGLDGYTFTPYVGTSSDSANQKIISVGNGIYVYRMNAQRMTPTSSSNVVAINATNGEDTFVIGIAIGGTCLTE